MMQVTVQCRQPWLNNLPDMDMLERIWSQCKGRHTAVSVYLAVCKYATEEGKECFTVKQERFAFMCGMHRTNIGDHLEELARVAAFRIKKNRDKLNHVDASTYTLLHCDGKDATGV
jgi:hypothetical protein